MPYYNWSKNYRTPSLSSLIDVAATHAFATDAKRIIESIDRVIFNEPATIIKWKDETKTVVKAQNEPYDKEKGLAMALVKRFCGDKGNFSDIFRKFIDDEETITKNGKKKSRKNNVRLNESK